MWFLNSQNMKDESRKYSNSGDMTGRLEGDARGKRKKFGVFVRVKHIMEESRRTIEGGRVPEFLECLGSALKMGKLWVSESENTPVVPEVP